MRFEQSKLQRESDERAIQLVADKGLSMESAVGIWTKRWEASVDLKTEFPSSDVYSAYMNSQLAKKQIQRKPEPEPSSNYNFLSADEAAMMASIQARHLQDDEARKIWESRWATSTTLQSEFLEAKLYSGLMIAVARGRVRIKTGR